MTEDYLKLVTDEFLLELYSDNYGQSVFCEGGALERVVKDRDLCKAEILRRMAPKPEERLFPHVDFVNCRGE